MRNIHIILILTAALWSVLPSGSPFRSIFDTVVGEPDGGVVVNSDPETDPDVIFIPPPR